MKLCGHLGLEWQCPREVSALCPIPLHAQDSRVNSARVPWVRWQEGSRMLLVQKSLCFEVFWSEV